MDQGRRNPKRPQKRSQKNLAVYWMKRIGGENGRMLCWFPRSFSMDFGKTSSFWFMRFRTSSSHHSEFLLLLFPALLLIRKTEESPTHLGWLDHCPHFFQSGRIWRIRRARLGHELRNVWHCEVVTWLGHYLELIQTCRVILDVINRRHQLLVLQKQNSGKKTGMMLVGMMKIRTASNTSLAWHVELERMRLCQDDSFQKRLKEELDKMDVKKWSGICVCLLTCSFSSTFREFRRFSSLKNIYQTVVF